METNISTTIETNNINNLKIDLVKEAKEDDIYQSDEEVNIV
jgi:hypothetical protein